jgi:hypothetical protein
MRDIMIASKLLFEYEEAAGRAPDVKSMYGRSMALFHRAKASPRW